MSLTRYHDEVLSRILNHGLVEADEFDRMKFLVRCVGEDLAVRNIGPLEVKRQNEDFIKYLFYHPKGVEMMMGMLASEDTLLQQTAANMAGFWSSEHQGMEKDGMELLAKLGEKLGLPGKVAEGAANSFKSLAVAWSGKNDSPLLQVYVSRSGGRQRSTSAGEFSHVPVLASAEVASGSLAPVRSAVGGGESTNAVESTNAISRSGGGRDHAGSGGGGVESSDQSVLTSGGGGHGGDASGQGTGRGEASSGLAQVASTRGDGGEDDQKWNVVRKLVDLVAHKRVPTLLVYVRALDAFFMSTSIRNALTDEEKTAIKSKLLKIVGSNEARGGGGSNQANREQGGCSNQASRANPPVSSGGLSSTATADHVRIGVDATRNAIRARTRLLAFSALGRLGLDPGIDGRELLQQVDHHLHHVQEESVIWFEEVERYEQLCRDYKRDPGEWLASKKWTIRGRDFSKLS